jgi:hypothetical protein
MPRYGAYRLLIIDTASCPSLDKPSETRNHAIKKLAPINAMTLHRININWILVTQVMK